MSNNEYTPTTEQIEAAARALWAFHGLNGEWEAGTREAHENCREDARNALVAAAGVTPQEPTVQVDEEEITWIVGAIITKRFNDCDYATAKTVARAVIDHLRGGRQ